MSRRGKGERVKIAGRTVNLNSETPQYFNLSLEQMRELASAASASHQNQHQLSSEESECCLHGRPKDVTRKFNTLPRRRKVVPPSPDIVKDVETKNQPMVKQEVKSSSSRVSRSKSFNVRRNQEKNDSAKEERSRLGGGGGLFAPTKSWLQYLNERKGINARKEMSSSFSKRTSDRTGSPQGRIRAKQEESTTTTDILQSEKKEANKSLASNGKETSSVVEMKNFPKNKQPQAGKKITYPSLKRNTKKVNKENKEVKEVGFSTVTGTTKTQTVDEEKKVSQQSKEGGGQVSNGTSRAASKVIEKVKSQMSQVSQKKKAVTKVDVKKPSILTKKSQSMKSSGSDATKSEKSSTGCNGVTSKNKQLTANGDVHMKQDNKNGSGYELQFIPPLRNSSSQHYCFASQIN